MNKKFDFRGSQKFGEICFILLCCNQTYITQTVAGLIQLHSNMIQPIVYFQTSPPNHFSEMPLTQKAQWIIKFVWIQYLSFNLGRQGQSYLYWFNILRSLFPYRKPIYKCLALQATINDLNLSPQSGCPVETLTLSHNTQSKMIFL